MSLVITGFKDTLRKTCMYVCMYVCMYICRDYKLYRFWRLSGFGGFGSRFLIFSGPAQATLVWHQELRVLKSNLGWL